MPPKKENTPKKMNSQPKSITRASAATPGRAIAQMPSIKRIIPSTMHHFQLIMWG
jgi:hypothetical protein